MIDVYAWLVNDPIGISIFALGRNILYLLIVLLIVTLMMRMIFNYMDESIGINFKDHVWENINDNPIAVALYFGLRVFGVLFVTGMVASSFIK